MIDFDIKTYPLNDIRVKERIIQRINTAKEKAFKDGIIFKGEHFDCDDRAQDRTGNRLLLLQAIPVETLEWLDFNYKPVVLSAAEFLELCACIFERIQFIEFKTGQLLEAVEACTCIEEVEAIEIDYSLPLRDDSSSVKNEQEATDEKVVTNDSEVV